ncbi:MAG: HIT domain-containing protein, partial [Actinobacteria bacterium]|nr:HIT domain-containing protein [Actinomycetota bacterium]
LGLPFVPGEILDEERAFGRFSGGCILCATIEAEHVDGKRVVLEDENTLVLCPYWSGMPYELLIIPKSHSAHLTDASTDSLHSMGVAIKRALITLNLALGDVAFNLGFHTAPGHHSGMYHWHVHLWPKLVTTAGFERGTGVLINIVPPEDAALALRNAAAK